MNKTLISLAIGALLLQACSKPAEPTAKVEAHAATVAWVKPDGANIDAIFAQAKASNKPVFLYWGAVWCPPCNQVKATVFNRQDFLERSNMVIPVYLDGDTPGAQKLGAQFKVKGYPTMILFKPDRTELTRLPGEVDAQRYVEVLDMAIASGITLKESLGLALGADKGKLTSQAWRQLAYYSWDQDEAQLVNAKDKILTLQKLAAACPSDQPGTAGRFALKAIVAHAQENKPVSDAAASTTQLQTILADAALSREAFDILVNYAADIVSALHPKPSTERQALIAQWSIAMDRLYSDAKLSNSDRLSAVYAKLALARIDVPKDGKFLATDPLLTQVREAVATANKGISSQYERQAVIPGAADLLSEAGLLDESDALLKAELPKALSPYYHMLVLSSNAKTRGDVKASLDWAERAWNESQGPATRLQWGTGYLTRLIDATPQDEARIAKAAMGIVQEVEPKPETFYERNVRNLSKLGAKLNAWNVRGDHGKVVESVAKQVEALCAKLPPNDETKATCSGISRQIGAKAKT